MGIAKGKVGIPFLMTTMAGLATVLGAAGVFFAKLANRTVLAVSLGIATGVMLFIAFYDLLALESIESFEKGGLEEKYAKLYATLSFFGGVLLLRLLDGGLHLVAHGMIRGQRPGGVPPLSDAHGHGTSLPSWMTDEDEKTPVVPAAATATPPSLPRQSGPTSKAPSKALDVESLQHVRGSTTTRKAGTTIAASDGNAAGPAPATDMQDTARLFRTGLLTAVVIGVHNFPEGVATFVSSLKDVKLGASMSLAIGLHNIPEGICVSMPVYYATGSKWKAVFWTFLSAMAEPFGGLIAYLALADVMTEVAFGILFGSIAGIVVSIVLVELLPAARRYDPDDKYVSVCIFVGMAVMALSLVLFDFAGGED